MNERAAIEQIKAMNRMLAETLKGPKFNGQIVLLGPSEMVTDPISGISYCTQEAWEVIKAEIPKEPSP